MSVLAASSSSFSPVEALLILAVVAIVFLVPAFFSGRIAAKKGYSFILFAFLGVFFGLIMLVIVAVMPRREAARIHPAQ